MRLRSELLLLVEHPATRIIPRSMSNNRFVVDRSFSVSVIVFLSSLIVLPSRTALRTPNGDRCDTSHRSCYRGNGSMIQGPSFRRVDAAPGNHPDGAVTGRGGLPAGYWASVPPSGRGIPGKTMRHGMFDRDSAPAGYTGHGTSRRQWSDGRSRMV